MQLTSKPITRTTAQVIGALDRDLLEQITRLQDEEAAWNQTTFDLSVTETTIAVAYDEKGTLIGAGTIYEVSPQSFWMGNVLVSDAMRRRGIGSKLVSELLSHAEAKK